MAININTVYKTVLSIMNKEQRGYLTPDEFNKIAKQVQLSLLDKSFYDLNKALTYKSRGLVNQGIADTADKIQEKIDALYKTGTATFASGSATLPTDIYKIISIVSNDRLRTYEEVKKHEITYMQSSPLAAPSSTFPVYYQETAGTSITTLPALANASTVTVDYIKKPDDPRWGYEINNQYGNKIYDLKTFVSTGLVPSAEILNMLSDADTGRTNGTYTNVALTSNSGSGTGGTFNVTVSGGIITSIVIGSSGTGYSLGDELVLDNSTIGGSLTATITLSNQAIYRYTTFGSTDFELHPSEEIALVTGILAYSGIVIRDSDITQLASQIIQGNEAIKQ
jgi:hypothetical protein